jgi:3-oxoacyl-[acyl-carrier-protein] synthase-3
LEPIPGKGGFVGFLLGTDGAAYQSIIVPASGARMPRTNLTKQEIKDESGIIRTLEHLHMDGPAIFFFSVCRIPNIIKLALDRFRLTLDDLDLVLLHQPGVKAWCAPGCASYWLLLVMVYRGG